MRKSLIIILLVSIVFFSCKRKYYSDEKITIEHYDSLTVENLAVLCKVWGFLKYYHPAVREGKYEWDLELFKIMPSIIECRSIEKRNKILYKWIEGIGEIVESKNPAIIDTNNIKIYPDLNWTEDETSLGRNLVKSLSEIKRAERADSSYYVKFRQFEGIGRGNPIFKNEKEYNNIDYPNVEYRLLALFRYWNIIQYYFPYRHLMDDNWYNVLLKFIPIFIDSKNELQYKLTLQELIVQIQDTHARLIDNKRTISEYWGKNSALYQIKFIENKAIVTGYYKSRYPNNLKIGDEILSINDVPIDNIIAQRLRYISGSNDPVKMRVLAQTLLQTNNQKLYIQYYQGNRIYADSIHCYDSQKIDYASLIRKDIPLFQIIDKNFGYLCLGSTQGGKMPEKISTNGLIIDLRHSINWEKIEGYIDFYQLYPDSIEYSKYTYGDIKYPGLFSFSNIDKVGHKNPDYYQGKKIILVNEQTQSHSEYMAMRYRCAPNAIVVGSTTAGADGNVSYIDLPGGIQTVISGIGIYYPDGTETQRVGIIPDIEVKPTIKGVREGRDEVLEKAIEIINKNK